jgi:hypothetical protein
VYYPINSGNSGVREVGTGLSYSIYGQATAAQRLSDLLKVPQSGN